MPAFAQSVGPSALDAAGASVAVGGNIYEYAIGQVMAGNTFSAPTLVVTPGVIQPNMTSAGIKGQGITASQLHVYPSPAESTLHLQPAFNGNGTLQYSLYDAAGKPVISREAVLQSGIERQSLDITRIAAGQYMLQVIWTQSGSTYTSGYKVQKVQ